jgi:hypothetical protein
MSASIRHAKFFSLPDAFSPTRTSVRPPHPTRHFDRVLAALPAAPRIPSYTDRAGSAPDTACRWIPPGNAARTSRRVPRRRSSWDALCTGPSEPATRAPRRPPPTAPTCGSSRPHGPAGGPGHGGTPARADHRQFRRDPNGRHRNGAHRRSKINPNKRCRDDLNCAARHSAERSTSNRGGVPGARSGRSTVSLERSTKCVHSRRGGSAGRC